jgi:photosystem II stability/assembly factor-like uncharacterized protein
MKNLFLRLGILLFLIVILFSDFIIPEEENEKEKEAGGIAESITEWAMQRAYPFEQIPMNEFSRSFESYKNNQTFSKDASASSWESIGPMNFGGRTLDIAFNPLDPNTMYAGAAGGGLWRSYSGGRGGNAWHYIPTGFPVLAVSSIAISPVDSNVIYIGTGEVYNYQNTGTGFATRLTRGTYGIGILKTIDGGNTWTKTLDWNVNELRGVQDIKINPSNPDCIWAATSEGVYRSRNAGGSWTLIHPILMATDINFHPTDTNIILVACGNSGSFGNGIYKTINAGNSFTKVTTGLPASYSGKTVITFSESSPSIVFASVADTETGRGLYKSTNTGDTWSLVNPSNIPTYQGWYSHDVAVNPLNPNTIIYVGIDCWKSTNSGVELIQKSYWYNWDFDATEIGGVEGLTDYVHADIHRVYYHPNDTNTIYFATDGGIFRTVNGGMTFEGCNGKYQTQQFYANFSNSYQDSLFAIGGMQDNATAIYEGNLGWRRAIGGDGLSTAINHITDEVVYGSSQYLNIVRSLDKGIFFSGLPDLPSGNSGNTNFAGPFVLCPSQPERLYAGRTELYRSDNTGDTWFVMNDGFEIDGHRILSIEVSPTNSSIVLVSTTPDATGRGRLYRSINSGDTFTDITGTLPDRYLMDMAIDANNNDIMYVVVSGFGTPHLYKSVDGGTNWNPISTGLPDVPSNTVTIDPYNSSIIYFGNDLGVFTSVDAGTNWNSFNEGLHDATMIFDLSVSPVNKKMRIATHGKGVYERPLLSNTVFVEKSSSAPPQVYHFPNPANQQATVKYELTTPGYMHLKLYNSSGKLINVIEKGFKFKGTHETRIDVSSLESGLYYYSVECGESSAVKKLLVMH